MTNHETPQRGYAEAILDDADAKKRGRLSSSKYRCTNHVSPTINIVERANSQAKLNMTNRRSYMSPETHDTETTNYHDTETQQVLMAK